jgi:GTP-binding protein
MDGSPRPNEAYGIIRNELAKYSPLLAAKREIVVGNKMDLTDAQRHLTELRDVLGSEVLGVSAVTGTGLEAMTERLWQMLGEVRASDEVESKAVST